MYKTRSHFVVVTAMVLAMAGLAACGASGGGGSGGTGSTSPATPSTATTSTASGGTSGTDVSSINPCSLLSDADVATLATGLGQGKVDTVAGVIKICDWPNSSGIPAVQLQVTVAPSTSLRSEVKNGLDANGGYAIVTVSGLGDEAVAAFQKANSSLNISAGLASIFARSGGKVVQLSTPMLSIQQNSAGFTKAKTLVAKVLAQL